MAEKDFVVSADGHIVEPTDLFLTRLPKHLRDRAFWEEDFEIEPLVEGGVRDFRRLRTPGFEGWTVSRYRHFDGSPNTGDPERIVELVGSRNGVTFAPPATLRLKAGAGRADLFSGIENILREIA